MEADKLRKAYQNFFIKDKAGQYFINEIIRLIVQEHDFAEEQPENARDHTQRAKGVRLVKEHIDSVVAERRAPKIK